jgi:hypothetical protein
MLRGKHCASHAVARISLALLAVALGAGSIAAPASAATPPDKIYWTDFGTTGGVSTVDVAGNNGGPLSIAPDPATSSTGGTYVDAQAGRIYFTDRVNKTIDWANLDGSGGGVVPNTSGANVTVNAWGITEDQATQTLYWANGTDDTIQSIDTDGSGGGVVASGSTLADNPVGIAIDTSGGTSTLYWGSYNSSKIMRAPITAPGVIGTATALPITGSAAISEPWGLAIDDSAAPARVYWSNYGGSIDWETVDGASGGTLSSITAGDITHPTGVIVDHAARLIYWTDAGSQGGMPVVAPGIFVGNLADGSATSKLLTSGAPAFDAPGLPSLLKAPAPGGGAGPAVTGGTTLGSVLSCSTGSWTPDAAPAMVFQQPTSYTYEWTLNGSVIAGQTGAQVTATSAGTYACSVVAANAAGTSDPEPGSTTVTVIGVPAVTAPPTITGTLVAGQTLTEAHGSWTNTPMSFAFQWLRCNAAGSGCTPISGARQQTYVLAPSDVGSTFEVEEIATNGSGASAPATSTPTGVVSPAPVTTALAATLGAVKTAAASGTADVSCVGPPGQACAVTVSGTSLVTKVGSTITAVAAKANPTPVTTRVTVLTATDSVPVGFSASVPLSLNSAGLAALAARYKLPVTVSIGSGAATTATFSYARIQSTILYTATFPLHCCGSDTLSGLKVLQVPPGATITLACQGSGCSPARQSFKPKGGTFSTKKGVKLMTLRSKARVAIEVTAPNSVGKVDIVTNPGSGSPTDRFRCLPPGARAPLACA